jgi:hypothetical protein
VHERAVNAFTVDRAFVLVVSNRVFVLVVLQSV